MHALTLRQALTPLVALGVGSLAAGCRDDGVTPLSPGAEPALAVAAAAVPAFTQLSTFGSHTCGITAAGRAYCWGLNSGGQLGDGTETDRASPTPVAGDLEFRLVSAGQSHSCGVTTDSQVYCWGFNLAGALGDGTTQAHLTPAPVSGGLRFRTVETGSHWTCGLTDPARRAYCWGVNSHGQLGDGTTTARLVPTAVSGGRAFREITLGAFHTCGVTTTSLAYCWGSDNEGQLGDGSERQDHWTPSAVAGGHAFTQIDAGYQNTCAVTPGDRAFCWGTGAIGDGRTLARFTPRAVAGHLSFERVTSGGGHACGESTTGASYCWGQNDLGQLGDGSSVTRLSPVVVKGGHVFAQLTAGSVHTCGVTQEAVAYCWGSNQWGQLGLGTTDFAVHARPVLVKGAE
jgi:alpha-tubulin suppressor-like RCC1 family protein